MTHTTNGGPAYPAPIQSTIATHHTGMTLRDHFAGLAMQGMLGQGDERAPQSELKLIVVQAYRMADMMLEARK